MEKGLKALYTERYNDNPEKTHSLIYLVELIELELPQPYLDSLFVINRIGVTGRYPQNIEKVLEQYTKAKTIKIISETKEILAWLMQKSLKAVNFFSAQIRNNGIRINEIILFGSSSTGTAKPGSDIDIAIISDDFVNRNFFDRALLTKDAEMHTVKKFKVPLDVITLTTE